jgi:hypothetical protein
MPCRSLTMRESVGVCFGMPVFRDDSGRVPVPTSVITCRMRTRGGRWSASRSLGPQPIPARGSVELREGACRGQ